MNKFRKRRWANKAQREKMAQMVKQKFPELFDQVQTQEPIVLNKTVTRYK